MKKYKRGITFGAFDPIHLGHINIFKRAKEQCYELVVCISDNDYLLKHKGHSERFPLEERINSLRSIKEIDYIEVQSLSLGKKEWSDIYGVDVIFVGDDWKDKNWNGADLGINVEYLPRTKGINSTQLTQ